MRAPRAAASTSGPRGGEGEGEDDEVEASPAPAAAFSGSAPATNAASPQKASLRYGIRPEGSGSLAVSLNAAVVALED